MELQSYASDLLEDAMTMAQTKALNSFSFRDCINTLTELWGYCYERMAQIDPGYYSRTIRLTQRLTRLPDEVRNVVLVYRSRGQVGFSRQVYREAGNNDLNSANTYKISGKDIYCWDAATQMIWVEYIPEPPFITFTKDNRMPKIVWKPGDKGEYPKKYEYVPSFDEFENGKYIKAVTPTLTSAYANWMLVGSPFVDWEPGHGFPRHSADDYPDGEGPPHQGQVPNDWDDPNHATKDNGRLIFRHRLTRTEILLDEFAVHSAGSTDNRQIDSTFWIRRQGWTVTFLKFDYPYTFISYRNNITGEYESYIDKNILRDSTNGVLHRNKYNPFDYTGRGSNVEFFDAKFNDYTGLGVTIFDHSSVNMEQYTKDMEQYEKDMALYKATGGQGDKPEEPDVYNYGVFKYLGFTPDTLLVYPTRIMYNYMVASLAQRFAAMNGSTVMAVELALAQAEDEMDKWMKVNKSAWMRANNVTGPTLCDFL